MKRKSISLVFIFLLLKSNALFAYERLMTVSIEPTFTALPVLSNFTAINTDISYALSPAIGGALSYNITDILAIEMRSYYSFAVHDVTIRESISIDPKAIGLLQQSSLIGLLGLRIESGMLLLPVVLYGSVHFGVSGFFEIGKRYFNESGIQYDVPIENNIKTMGTASISLGIMGTPIKYIRLGFEPSLLMFFKPGQFSFGFAGHLRISFPFFL